MVRSNGRIDIHSQEIQRAASIRDRQPHSPKNRRFIGPESRAEGPVKHLRIRLGPQPADLLGGAVPGRCPGLAPRWGFGTVDWVRVWARGDRGWDFKGWGGEWWAGDGAVKQEIFHYTKSYLRHTPPGL